MSEFYDVWILEPNDPERCDHHKDKWAAVDKDNNIIWFPSEEDVCAYQRYWRRIHNRNEMTAEPA